MTAVLFGQVDRVLVVLFALGLVCEWTRQSVRERREERERARQQVREWARRYGAT